MGEALAERSHSLHLRGNFRSELILQNYKKLLNIKMINSLMRKFHITTLIFQYVLLGMRFIVDFQGPNSRLF